MLKVKDIVSLWLCRMGVRTLFGIPGSYVLPLIDSATRHGMPFVLSQHEYGAALMADGYAKAGGGIPCVITTTGIGATNALSGLYNSYTDSQPVILITGQVPTSQFGKGALQECVGAGRTLDLAALFKQLTKYSELITRCDQLLPALQQAEHALLEGRPGPIHLSIPIDILQTSMPFESFMPSLAVDRPSISSDERERLGAMLAEAKQPLLLLGAGCQSGEAAGYAIKLMELGIPAVTTLRGKGTVDEEHPLCLGCIGMYGRSEANFVLDRQTDLLIAVGVSMGEFTTQCWDPAIGRHRLIHVDIDKTQLGKNYKSELPIHADAAGFLKSAADWAATSGRRWNGRERAEEARLRFRNKVRGTGIASPSVQPGERGVPLSDAAHAEAARTVSPIAAVNSLYMALPRDRTTWVSDSVTWTETHMKAALPRSHIEAVNQASIGYAPPAAIGAKLARPDRYVVAVFGDGGFRQTAMELATAVTHRVPVLWVMLNNGMYGSIYAAQQSYYDGNIVGTTYEPIDYRSLGSAMGVETRTIESEEQLAEAVASFLAEERPMLLDVRIDDTMPVAKARQLIRYQQWKLESKKSAMESSESASAQLLKQLIQNRY